MNFLNVMSDTPEETVKEAPAPSNGKNKTMMILLIVLGTGFVAMAAILFTPLGNSFLNKEQKQESKGLFGDPNVNGDLNRQVTFLPLPELLVNLKPYRGKTAILKATFVLQIAEEKEREEINHFTPIITDQFQTFLREMNVTDLQGASGIERIRQELLVRINQIVKPYKVMEVLVKDFLIQ